MSALGQTSNLVNLSLELQSTLYIPTRGSTYGKPSLISVGHRSVILSSFSVNIFKGWDWGPAFIPAGIFKPAYFISLNGDDIDDVTTISQQVVTPPQSISKWSLSGSDNSNVFVEETSVDIYKVGQNQSVIPNEKADWLVNVSIAVRSAKSFAAPSIQLSIPELGISSETIFLSSIQAKTDDVTWISTQWEVPDRYPLRWFPHDMKTGPRLYDLTVLITFDGIPLHLTFRTGFRTVQLLQDQITEAQVQTGVTPGDRFTFKVNLFFFFASRSASLNQIS